VQYATVPRESLHVQYLQWPGEVGPQLGIPNQITLQQVLTSANKCLQQRANKCLLVLQANNGVQINSQELAVPLIQQMGLEYSPDQT
jgi:hypothetical protein